jgi:hypothetical protein
MLFGPFGWLGLPASRPCCLVGLAGLLSRLADFRSCWLSGYLSCWLAVFLGLLAGWASSPAGFAAWIGLLAALAELAGWASSLSGFAAWLSDFLSCCLSDYLAYWLAGLLGLLAGWVSSPVGFAAWIGLLAALASYLAGWLSCWLA